MDSLPPELLAYILRITVSSADKNVGLDVRLVCRSFDQILKPILCETLNLDVSRLSRLSHRRHPTEDALQTIGYHCKALFLDLMILRDEQEVEFLRSMLDKRMNEFCDFLRERYCLHERTFTQDEYSRRLDMVLFNCRNIERLRLYLPSPLSGRYADVATWILAITFRALRNRPEEDSARLKVLVLENVTDSAVYLLWRNPVDMGNIRFVMEELKHLVISMRRADQTVDQHEIYSLCLWDIIIQAESLDSLCLIGIDTGPFRRGGVKTTTARQMFRDEWKVKSLTCTTYTLFYVTRLELRKVDLHPDFFDDMARGFGQTLEELYLNTVALKVCAQDVLAGTNPAPLLYAGGHHHQQQQQQQQPHHQVQLPAMDVLYPFPALWVGIPNRENLGHYQWVAPSIRAHFGRLRVCRAVDLGYDFYGSDEELAGCQSFDLEDPCGLGRELGQRFVEVVMGFEQPDMLTSTSSAAATAAAQAAAAAAGDGDLEMTSPVDDTPVASDLDANPGAGASHHSQPFRLLPAPADAYEEPAAAARAAAPLAPRPEKLQAREWNAVAHQHGVGNPTSSWLTSLDGVFPNCNTGALRELHNIAHKACHGMRRMGPENGDDGANG